jgi:hypothetical protein
MFARSRNGRRGLPARLNIERLEARVLLHSTPLAAGLSAPASPSSPAAVVRPLPDGPSHGHAPADSQAGGLFTSSDTGKHADKGQGNGGTPGGHRQGLSALASGLGDDPASGKHGHGHQDVLSHDIQAKDASSGGKGHGAAKKGHEMSDDDAASGRVSSEDASSAVSPASEAVFHTNNGQIQLTTRDLGESTGASPRAAEVSELADDVVEAPSPVSSHPLAATAEGAGTQAPAQSAATVISVLGVPRPVPGREAAPQDNGDNSVAGAAQTAAQAAGTAAVLAVRAARPAEFAPPSGQGAAAPAVAVTTAAAAVTGPADVRLLRGGALAEAAAPGGDAPAAMLGPFPAFAAPLAGMLLERLAADTRALDAALLGFSHGLDRLGESLAGPRSRLGVTAWVLTGVAALTALEWDRRRRAAAAGADEVPLSWLDPGGPAI